MLNTNQYFYTHYIYKIRKCDLCGKALHIEIHEEKRPVILQGEIYDPVASAKKMIADCEAEIELVGICDCKNPDA